jgi:DNA-directed RNA polymerase alpha subunit
MYNKNENENLDIHIDDCDFTLQLYTCFLAARIHTLRGVCELTESELFRMVRGNLGQKSLDELKTFLASKGLSLRTN